MGKKAKKENKEKAVGGSPETTTPEQNFQNRKGLAESRLRGILEDLELGIQAQLHVTQNGIVPVVTWTDKRKEEETEEVQDDKPEANAGE